MGRGIVATPNDFGSQGSRPSHPELLDWLAEALIKNGWRLKPIHRLIVTSAVYMQDSRYDEARAAVDRDNVLPLAAHARAGSRPSRFATRCSTAAGRLDTRMYGPGTLDPAMPRRSVYFRIKRSQLVPMMMLFDWPEHLVSIGQREHDDDRPPGPVVLERRFGPRAAPRLRRSSRHRGRPRRRSRPRGYRIAFGREPTDDRGAARRRVSRSPAIRLREPKAGPSPTGRRPSTFARHYWK